MAKFCENCGAELAAKAKFCGACGNPAPIEVHNCPTCGQLWDRVKVGAKEETAPVVIPVTKPAPVVSATPNPTVIAHNTTANIEPIYGALYVEGRDCPNCGSANMAKKICKICESEN